MGQLTQDELDEYSRALTAGAKLGSGASQELFHQNVIEEALDAESCEQLQSDTILIIFGQMLFHECGRTKQDVCCRIQDILQLMRHMNKKSVEEIVVPGTFDEIIRGVNDLRAIVELNVERLGHSLKLCCQIIRGQALRNDSLEESYEMEDFLMLMDIDFYD